MTATHAPRKSHCELFSVVRFPVKFCFHRCLVSFLCWCSRTVKFVSCLPLSFDLLCFCVLLSSAFRGRCSVRVFVFFLFRLAPASLFVHFFLLLFVLLYPCDKFVCVCLSLSLIISLLLPPLFPSTHIHFLRSLVLVPIGLIRCCAPPPIFFFSAVVALLVSDLKRGHKRGLTLFCVFFCSSVFRFVFFSLGHAPIFPFARRRSLSLSLLWSSLSYQRAPTVLKLCGSRKDNRP